MKRKARWGKIRGGWVNLRREINQECNGSIYPFRNNVKKPCRDIHAAPYLFYAFGRDRLLKLLFNKNRAARYIYRVFQPVQPRDTGIIPGLGIIKPSAYCCRHENVVIFLASCRQRRFPCNLTSSRHASVHSREKELHIHVCIQISDPFSNFV